jgi:hypothetical protein
MRRSAKTPRLETRTKPQLLRPTHILPDNSPSRLQINQRLINNRLLDLMLRRTRKTLRTIPSHRIWRRLPRSLRRCLFSNWLLPWLLGRRSWLRRLSRVRLLLLPITIRWRLLLGCELILRNGCGLGQWGDGCLLRRRAIVHFG